MDDQVTTNFKSLYIKNIFYKYHEATSSDVGIILNKFWKTKLNIMKAVRSTMAA
jgi:hypothetical protein